MYVYVTVELASMITCILLFEALLTCFSFSCVFVSDGHVLFINIFSPFFGDSLARVFTSLT